MFHIYIYKISKVQHLVTYMCLSIMTKRKHPLERHSLQSLGLRSHPSCHWQHGHAFGLSFSTYLDTKESLTHVLVTEVLT